VRYQREVAASYSMTGSLRMVVWEPSCQQSGSNEYREAEARSEPDRVYRKRALFTTSATVVGDTPTLSSGGLASSLVVPPPSQALTSSSWVVPAKPVDTVVRAALR
jgi:hypothetical protein